MSKQTSEKAAQQGLLELKIIDEANKQKKLIERIVGFTDFDWYYHIIKLTGTCSVPTEFTLLEEVICDLLLLDKELPLGRIGEILGFDTSDRAEKTILLETIEELKKIKCYKATIYWLTDIGIKYAKKGVKFSTFTKQFELYIDTIGDVKENTKEVFNNLTYFVF